jgi:hypothetical protein
MSLDNISFSRYLTDPTQKWLPEHYRVRNIVRAIKGDPFNGYASLRIGNVIKRLDSANPQVAVEWFVDRVATEIKFSNGDHFLCPIPGSQCTPSSTETPRTLQLAQSLSQRLPQLKVWDHLRFKEPMAKKIRDEEVLYRNLVCTARVPSGYLILLDDVCTTGAHARAAQRRLQEDGAGEMCAMSVTRTMHSPDEKVFGVRSDPL